MDVRELVAWNLRRLRVARGLSQDALAADANVDRAYVGRVERALENPTIGVLDRLAQALECGIVAFFDVPAPGDEPPQPLPGGRKPPPSSRVKRTTARKTKDG